MFLDKPHFFKKLYRLFIIKLFIHVYFLKLNCFVFSIVFIKRIFIKFQIKYWMRESYTLIAEFLQRFSHILPFFICLLSCLNNIIIMHSIYIIFRNTSMLNNSVYYKFIIFTLFKHIFYLLKFYFK